MKNKISDLRNHLFEQLERLNNDELSAEQLDKEIKRAQAMSEIGKVIVDSAKTQVMAMKVAGNNDVKGLTEDTQDFTESAPKNIVRPPANYSNNGHAAVLDKYS